MADKDSEDLTKRRICADCIGEFYLKEMVSADGKNSDCSYCNDEGKTYQLDEISEIVEAAFGDHFVRTASEPNSWQTAMLNNKEINYDWEREGVPIKFAIMDAADIPETAAENIQTILADKHHDFDSAAMGEEGEFSSETYYEETLPADEEWQEGWRSFEKTIKSEARFFSQTGAAQLSKLFDTIDEMRTSQSRPLVVEAGPDTEISHLYRARVFQSSKNLKPALIRPDLELSAPPSQLANSGRMNARGISVFYGATDVDIALAEVRPPVGSQVAIARFEIVRPIKLLDLTALGEVHEKGSVFDSNYAYRLSRMMFLRSLSSRMARPVMPDDQDFEYLPTQAIADYLATEGKVRLDGILYPSVQVSGTGLNAVLFHKSSRCAEIEIPIGTELSATTCTYYEVGPEPDYSVVEEVPSDNAVPENGKQHDPFSPNGLASEDWADIDRRETTIRVDLNSVRVHIVKTVRLVTSDYEVRRHRWLKTELPF